MKDVQDDLHRRVRDAIASLPAYFRTETKIEGVNATDLHTLNTVLGATIEEQVVRTLNDLRNSWDPDERYALYSFVRQAQTFPGRAPAPSLRWRHSVRHRTQGLVSLGEGTGTQLAVPSHRSSLRQHRR